MTVASSQYLLVIITGCDSGAGAGQAIRCQIPDLATLHTPPGGVQCPQSALGASQSQSLPRAPCPGCPAWPPSCTAGCKNLLPGPRPELRPVDTEQYHGHLNILRASRCLAHREESLLSPGAEASLSFRASLFL